LGIFHIEEIEKMDKVEHYSVDVMDEETIFSPKDGPKTGIEEMRETLNIKFGYLNLPDHPYDICIYDIAANLGVGKNLDSMKPELFAVYESWDDEKIIHKTGYHIVVYGVKHLWIDIKPRDDSSCDSCSDRSEDYDFEHDDGPVFL
jgi:hypothetical protein